MSDQKKDLTRIEDLGEYIHELNAEEELESSEEGLPDLPPEEDEVPPFESAEFGAESSFETTEFGETEDVPDFGSSSDFGSSTEFESSEPFGEETSPTFGATDDSFETSDFGSSFGDETPVEENEAKEKEGPSWDSDFPTAPTEDDNSEEGISLSEAEPVVESSNGPEPEIGPETEPAPVETPEVDTYTPSADFKTPENFEDLKKFSESSSFTGMATEGNPSFSVLVKNVRFLEDINDIISLLKEFNLLADSEEQTKGRLMRGTLLIPRISEYAAVFVAHKLRRFDVDLQIGPSDEIHPPKHQETPETGIVSRHSLYQNQTHHFQFDDPKLELSQIIVAATSSLEGHQVVRYMGVASEHKILDSYIVEDENSSEIPSHYQELAQKLKAHALKNHSNAVVGLNYQLTPIPSEFGMGGHKYRLTCTGNLVWVNKL
ncbi:MAG: hypothetical protein ACLGHN_00695 [Bacteriovoracia bacterium]